MVLTVKVPIPETEKVKIYLMKHNLIETGYHYVKEDGYIFFPVSMRFDMEGTSVSFEIRNLEPVDKNISWRDAARAILSPAAHSSGRFSFDTVGSIAIVEIVEDLVPKEVELAKLLIETVSKITTVLKKDGGHEGEFRVQKMKLLAGEDTREAIVSENGCRFKINVETVYYSVRLGTERTRIMKLIKPDEKVLCMFSGAAPYPIVFAKNTRAKELVGVEINPEGHKYGLENVKLNKVNHVKLICGDVKVVVPKFIAAGETFDRITMPLPHTGEEFLPVALDAITSGGTIHYYCFIDRDDMTEEQRRIVKIVTDTGKKIAAFKTILCGQHSPRRYRVCFDIKIS